MGSDNWCEIQQFSSLKPAMVLDHILGIAPEMEATIFHGFVDNALWVVWIYHSRLVERITSASAESSQGRGLALPEKVCVCACV